MIDIRSEEVKFMSEINQIIKDNFKLFSPDITNIELSTTDEDTKESFDLVYNSKIEISVRIRNNRFLSYCDFTIRSKSMWNNLTEIDKLIEGKGSVYLYAWKTTNNESFESWILVDIKKIREKLSERKDKERSNFDGTRFIPYPVNWLIENDGLINSYNLPRHVKKAKNRIEQSPIEQVFF